MELHNGRLTEVVRWRTANPFTLVRLQYLPQTAWLSGKELSLIRMTKWVRTSYMQHMVFIVLAVSTSVCGTDSMGSNPINHPTPEFWSWYLLLPELRLKTTKTESYPSWWRGLIANEVGRIKPVQEFEPLTLYSKCPYGGIGIRNGLRSHPIEGSNPSMGTKLKK